jgi:hypothetical protein
MCASKQGALPETKSDLCNVRCVSEDRAPRIVHQDFSAYNNPELWEIHFPKKQNWEVLARLIFAQAETNNSIKTFFLT